MNGIAGRRVMVTGGGGDPLDDRTPEEAPAAGHHDPPARDPVHAGMPWSDG